MVATEKISLFRVLDRAKSLLAQAPGTNLDPQLLPDEDTEVMERFIEQKCQEVLDERFTTRPNSGSWPTQTPVGVVWLRRQQIKDAQDPTKPVNYQHIVEIPWGIWGKDSLHITQIEESGLARLTRMEIISPNRTVSFTPLQQFQS